MNKTNQCCEWYGCKKQATQADVYQNMWFCNDHYSYIGSLNHDYCNGGEFIDYDDLTLNQYVLTVKRP